MTPAQRKQFNIGQRILDELINSRLIIHLAKSQKIWPTPEEIKEVIKEQEYFQTDKKFDVNKYKIVLKNAELNPGSYEKEISEDLAQRKMIEVLNVYPSSTSSKTLVAKIKNSGLEVNAIRVTHSNMKTGLIISKEEISKFTADQKNKTVLENAFNRNKYRFETPASKNLKIISLDYTAETLAKVEKETQVLKNALNSKNFEKNPKFDKKQGNVGWVSAGKLPPEIENVLFSPEVSKKTLKGMVLGPIKTEQAFLFLLVEDEKVEIKKLLADVSSELAEEQIRNLKSEELKTLVKTTVKNLQDLLKNGNTKEIEKIQKSYSFTWEKSAILSPIEKQIGPISLDSTQFDKIFDKPIAGTVLTFDNPTETLVLKIERIIPLASASSIEAVKLAATDDPSQKNVQSQRTNILKKLKEQARISINKNML
jgi:hypothetical protein